MHNLYSECYILEAIAIWYRLDQPNLTTNYGGSGLNISFLSLGKQHYMC